MWAEQGAPNASNGSSGGNKRGGGRASASAAAAGGESLELHGADSFAMMNLAMQVGCGVQCRIVSGWWWWCRCRNEGMHHFEQTFLSSALFAARGLVRPS